MHAYGFSGAPISLARRPAPAANVSDAKTAAALSLVALAEAGKAPAQAWGVARKGGNTILALAIFSTRHAIAPALAVKTALSIAETAGFKDLSVLVSSVGDQESRRRFTRELGNFFRKRTEEIPADAKEIAAQDPDAAYRLLLSRKDPIADKMPRSIDYLSENSRKTMLSALSLFESVGIPYVLDSRLTAEPGAESELLFAIEGSDSKGNRIRIAQGGRYDEVLKRLKGGQAEPAVAISLELSGKLSLEEPEDDLTCFVVHVGDAAKLRAFALLEALWRAEVYSGQALMAENLREQVMRGTALNTRYLVIIGQREALDGTVIVRSVSSETQTTLPLDKLSQYVTRRR